jgi:hypothetical protein
MGITALIALIVSGVSASLAGAWRLVLVIRTPKERLVDAAREMQGTRFSVRLGGLCMFYGCAIGVIRLARTDWRHPRLSPLRRLHPAPLQRRLRPSRIGAR